MDRTPVNALNAIVSCESIDVTDAQPMTYGIDDACNLMAGNSRILHAWPVAFLGKGVAVTDTALSSSELRIPISRVKMGI
jgi:hypothetical protein